MKTFLILICLTLGACATGPSQLEQDIAERKAKRQLEYADHTIQVQTLPAGAIIDWNGDVAGVSPCQVTIKEAYKGEWPFNGYNNHVLRARWTDGYGQEQFFIARTPAPKHVIFLHPDPSKITPQPPNLTQR